MKKYLSFVCILSAVLVSTGAMALVTSPPPQFLTESPVYAPYLDERFLTDSEITAAELGMRTDDRGDMIGLAVAHYDLTNGLLAGYEARNGERVLMLAAQNEAGNVNARMLFHDPQTGHVHPAMTLALVGEGREKEVAIFAGGVDVLDALHALKNDTGARIAQRQALTEFMISETGQAALEAIPVLYALLEPMDLHDPDLARMKAPFGAMRMAMELAAGTYAGLPAATEVFTEHRLSEMQAACPEHLCQLRTLQFTIHANGLFDVLTDMDAAIACLSEEADSIGFQPMYDNDCFGCCGPGCWGCTGISNAECFGHDQCVCQYSHLQCIFGSPSGCGGQDCAGAGSAVGYCTSLVSAIIGFLRDLFGFGGGGGDGGGDGGGGYTLPPWPDMPCFSIEGCNDCLNDPTCVPGFPTDPY